MAKPTAATHFSKPTTAQKAAIQVIFDAIAAGADRTKILGDVTTLGMQMSGDDRDQLVSMAYQQLRDR